MTIEVDGCFSSVERKSKASKIEEDGADDWVVLVKETQSDERDSPSILSLVLPLSPSITDELAVDEKEIHPSAERLSPGCLIVDDIDEATAESEVCSPRPSFDFYCLAEGELRAIREVLKEELAENRETEKRQA